MVNALDRGANSPDAGPSWGHCILVPSATRLKMSLTSSSGRTKKFEFFHWLTKNECEAEMKITELYAFHFTSGPGGRFSKAPEAFRARKAITKSRTLRVQSYFIHIFLRWREVHFIQEVSSVYTSPFLDTDDLKMALRARKLSGAFEKRAPVHSSLARFYYEKRKTN